MVKACVHFISYASRASKARIRETTMVAVGLTHENNIELRTMLIGL